MNLVVDSQNIEQPVLYQRNTYELNVAIASLSLGGAERIVLDWARRIYPRWRVHLIVIKDREKEWPVPDFVKVTRLHDKNIVEQLKAIGKTIATSGNSTCVCHLFNKKWRDALSESGVNVVTVLYNAKNGWGEDISHLVGSTNVIAVSQACEKDLRDDGWPGPVSVIRHIPPIWKLKPDAREHFRQAWNIPQHATVIGMIGAVKPQKNYLFALRVLKKFLEMKDAYLIIVGGPVNTKCGRSAWGAVVNEIGALGLRNRVAMPGFIPGATSCLPAFDVMLNTSHYEGLSMATLEALANKMPVVASKVGGQGEIGCDGLILVHANSSEEAWVSAISEGLGKKFETPSWARFPAYRLWTLASLARMIDPSDKVLFLTENLNSGGAQRSLVNLTKALRGKIDFSIAVGGNSTSSYFYRQLKKAGIKVERSADSSDAFTDAETLTQKICNENIGTVCFWNFDRRVKLLLVKALGFTKVRFIDVSPGAYSFEEMNGVAEFEQLICFSQEEYYKRLNELVLKYRGWQPEAYHGKVSIIPNGVPRPLKIKKNYTINGRPRIVVSGRIAPTKFALEIIEAVRLTWEKIPGTELHFYGGIESKEEKYAEDVLRAADGEVSNRIFFHGANFEAVNELYKFDAYVVLGKNQGCPNALLEALAVGLPSIANDDGGTREQLIDGKTGLLIKNCDPKELSQALLRILIDRDLARELGQAGRAHVMANFSIEKMCREYVSLFGEKMPEAETIWERIRKKMGSWFPKQTEIEKEELQWR